MNNKETYNLAKSFLGQGGAVFRKYCGLPSGAAWCNAFVTYIFHKSGNANLYCGGKKQTYCPTSIKLCRKDMAEIPMYLAMPMDVIYFDWDRNGVPNHIGFVREKVSTDTINTIEGNTSNKVMLKSRPKKYVCGIFRPHFKATFTLKKLAVDGDCGHNTIAGLQKALGGIAVDGILGIATVKRLQKYLAISQDGVWGKGTSKAVQKLVGAKQDGEFGPASVKKLQEWINKKVYPSTSGTPTVTKPTTSSNADKLVSKMKDLAWAYGTPEKKWKYKTGAPKSTCKTAMNKYGFKTKIQLSDCGHFVATVVRASGVDKSFTPLKGTKESFPSCGSHFSIVYKGKKIPDGTLKPGDIIRYKKKSGQHAMFYFGDGKICDAGRGNRFGNIRKNDHRYNKSNVKYSTIQVLRAK